MRTSFSFCASFLRILYPAHCPLCDTLLEKKEALVCTACRNKAHPRQHFFPGGWAPFSYTGEFREALHRFKYGGRIEYAAFFADSICAAGAGQIHRWQPDVLLPVPIHASRRRKRGYNQAEELAKALSRRLQIPVEKRLVRRVRKTLPQNGLSPSARRCNVQGAFSLCKYKTVPPRILLVDDIHTTGSTLKELESEVRRGGAKEVHAVCVCDAASVSHHDASVSHHDALRR